MQKTSALGTDDESVVSSTYGLVESHSLDMLGASPVFPGKGGEKLEVVAFRSSVFSYWLVDLL